jgi:thiol-disulfide isomerase/thioredoxin
MSFAFSKRLVLTVGAVIALLTLGSAGCRKNSETAGSNGAGKNSNVSVTVSSSDNPTITTSGLTRVPQSILNAQVQTLDGKTIKLADYAGKVVVLDIWATWCGPCRQEIPHLIELNNQYKAQGLEVVGLTMEDPATDVAKVNEFAQQFKINYQLGWASREMAVGILQLSRNDSIPQTLIITRDGRILKHYVGFHPINTPISMKNIIEQAIKL